MKKRKTLMIFFIIIFWPIFLLMLLAESKISLKMKIGIFSAIFVLGIWGLITSGKESANVNGNQFAVEQDKNENIKNENIKKEIQNKKIQEIKKRNEEREQKKLEKESKIAETQEKAKKEDINKPAKLVNVFILSKNKDKYKKKDVKVVLKVKEIKEGKVFTYGNKEISDDIIIENANKENSLIDLKKNDYILISGKPKFKFFSDNIIFENAKLVKKGIAAKKEFKKQKRIVKKIDKKTYVQKYQGEINKVTKDYDENLKKYKSIASIINGNVSSIESNRTYGKTKSSELYDSYSESISYLEKLNFDELSYSRKVELEKHQASMKQALIARESACLSLKHVFSEGVYGPNFEIYVKGILAEVKNADSFVLDASITLVKFEDEIDVKKINHGSK